MNFKYELGAVLKDKVTNFEGVVVGRSDYATGCIQYGLLARKTTKDGEVPKWQWLDEERLTPTGERVEIVKGHSGPAPSPPEQN